MVRCNAFFNLEHMICAGTVLFFIIHIFFIANDGGNFIIKQTFISSHFGGGGGRKLSNLFPSDTYWGCLIETRPHMFLK